MITTHPHYQTGRVDVVTPDDEEMDGVNVRRLHALTFGKRSLAARGLTAILFASAAFLAVISTRPRPAVVLAMSPSLFAGAAAGLAARLRGAGFIYDIEDFHPDVAVEIGAVTNRCLILALRALERLVLVLASHLVVISAGFREIAIARGLDARRISVIPNWADPAFVEVPSSRSGTALSVVFVGTLGLAQDLDVLIDAAALCEKEVTLKFVGDGVAKPHAMRRAARLNNVHFVPRQPHDEIARFLREADVALIALRAGRTLAATIPSKTYEYLAAGRPIIAVAGAEVEQLLDGAGICLPQGSSAEVVAAALRELMDRPRRMHMSERAVVIAREYSRDMVVGRYVQVVEHLASSRH